MVEYELTNNLAFSPFCFGEDAFDQNNLLYGKTSASDQLLDDCDLYFNGFNSSFFDGITNIDPSKVLVNTKCIDDINNNLDFGSIINGSYCFDYTEGDEATSGQQSDVERSIASIEKTTPFGSPLSSISSVAFDFIETLDTDEFIPDQQKDIFSFGHIETPLGSPISSVDMSLEFVELQSMANVVSPETNSKTILTEHMYAKTPDYKNEFVSFGDLNLNPRSIDSGISVSSSDTDEMSVDSDEISGLLNFDDNQSNNSIAVLGLEENVDFAVGKQNINLDEMHPIVESTTGSSSRNSPESDRFSPYKGKQKKTCQQKLVKKKQNRQAASKYRSKKKDEVDTIFVEVEKLEGRNTELKESVEGLRKEIDYLKSLMLDVIKARLTKKVNLNVDVLLSSLMINAH